ncbi:MAG TPA: HlyC/CorC family transporter [Clostridiales bacterium]|nr:hemolysin family protein [Clostridia bacterium]HCS76118.1 HlyC/CorC family transporter [Clostridiales bacterium]
MLTNIIVIILLVMLNAYFAGSEMALVSINDNKIRLMADAGDKKAASVKKLLDEPGKFLSTIQIGITLAGFLSSAFASDAFADKLAAWVLSLGVPVSYNVIKHVSMIAITLILSYFTLVFGELLPKRLAMQQAEKVSLKVVGPLHVLGAVTSPLVKLLTASTNFFVKLAGGNPYANEEEVTEEEIRMMIDVGEEKGTIDEIEKVFINNVFDFDDKVVADIMTHRTRVAAVSVDSSLDEIVEVISLEKYTRIPIYKESIDNIIGVLHVKDLLKYFTSKQDNAPFEIHNFLRRAYFVPESKKINELFRELQVKKIHMVVVVDEYGGTAGIITIEDLLEEIVGSILDEYDEEEYKYEKIDESTYLFDGSISLDQVAELIGVILPVEEYETLSGYVIGQLGQIPDEGEKPVIELDDLVFKVEEIEDKMLSRIKVCKV